MEAILNFLTGIGDAIISIFEFIVALFRDFMRMLELLAKVPSAVASALSWLPDVYLSSLAVIFLCVILYKILGREG